MTKWEYCWTSGDLNELGAEGWEAVGVECDVSSDINGDIRTNTTVLMKRPSEERKGAVELRPATESVGSMNSQGPLTTSPQVSR